MQSPTRQIPIYVAALGPKMLRLTGEIADGVLLYFCPPSKMPGAIAEIQKGAEQAKRPPTNLDVAAFLPTFVSENAEQARMAVAKVIAYYVGGMGLYYHRMVSESGFQNEADSIRTAWLRGDRVKATQAVTPQLVDTMALAGTPQECRTRLQEFRRAGVSLPILSLSVGDQNARRVAIDSIKILAAE
jgi:alkanesulfonate monooxygenase SsuD/methylene tetrahydromethanopterin reductase-like flavin-dependent oxidoreductase (luciferase family)